MMDTNEAPALPPGPRAPRLLQTLRFAVNSRPWLDACFRRFGEGFTARLLGMGTVVVLSDPEAIEALFNADPETVLTGESNARMFESFLGTHSLLNQDGARHRRKRRLLMPPFHGQRMHLFGPVMQKITQERMARWRVGKPFSIQQDMQIITLEVMLRAVFGVDDEEKRQKLRAAILHFLEGTYRPEAAVMAVRALQVDLGPRSPWGSILRRRNAAHAAILEAISDRRRAGTAGRADILSLLIEARDESGQPMSDEELRDDLFTLLLVGHETTATTLAWAFAALLHRPDVVEKLQQEARAVMGGGPIDAKRLSELPYLDATVKEVTRLYPVNDGAARLCKAPTRLGRFFVPSGVMVAASSWLAHRNPRCWRDPDAFLPERFVGTRPAMGSFLPFGGGLRTCVGLAFSTYEMKVILLEILGRAALKSVEERVPKADRHVITHSPRGGVPVILLRPIKDAYL